MSAANGFAQDVSAIESLITAERADAAIDPRCVPVFMHHGHATDGAIVLFHGFTNCPRQFVLFGRLLFERGFNVYIPRLPLHGMRDKLTPVLEALTTAELTTCAASAIQAVAHLAPNTSAVGLSLGATMVAWLAQTHALERAIAIAPFFSVAHIPSLLEPALAATLTGAPNLDLWWDPRRKADIGPAHGYPRFPTHALARCLQLGETVRDLAHRRAPCAAQSTLVLNAKDPAIDNAAAQDVWQLWRRHGSAVTDYTFDNLDARHDIIEPETYPDARTLVYPVLMQLIGQ